MKGLFLAMGAALISLAGSAFAAEFQPLGNLGIGGAGVARQNGALTAYWNPAGGAFNDKSFSFATGAEAGMRGSDGLTQNIDRLHGIDFNNIKNFNGGNATPQTVGDVVKLITILNDIKNRGGNVTISGAAPVGFAIKHFSFGLYSNFEGYVQPMPDTVNILPSTGSGTVTATDLYNSIKNDPGAASNNGYFNSQQYNSMVSAFTQNGLSTAQAQALVNSIEAQLTNSGIPASSVSTTTTTILSQALSNPSGATLDKNATSVLSKAFWYFEAPLAYGHPIDLGSFGVLGIGASVKVIRGTVYQNQALLVNTPNSLSSSDLARQMVKNQQTTNAFGVDAGLLWKYADKLSVGVVGKNLNSPKFDAPTYQAPMVGNPTVMVPVKGSDITLAPQVRGGIAYDPWKWFTLAADVDITENAAVVPGASVKSRNVGGGLEMRPWSWFKLRMGAYKNLATSTGPVGTFGFTLGPVDIDAAASTDTFKYQNTTLPDEARVQMMCGFSF